MRTAFLLLASLAFAAPAAAQPAAEAAEEDAICADRPGLTSSTCTVAPGRAQVELQLDWSFQEDGASRTETLLAGSTLVRIGVGPRTEVQVGLPNYGRVRTRDGMGVSRENGLTDATLGVRHLLAEGRGAAVAVQATLSLPIGSSALTAGDWGAELLVPLGYETGNVELLLTPSIAAAVDQDGRGRHLAYGISAGAGFNLSERLSATFDVALARDEDPLGSTTEALAGLAFAYQVSRDLQLDAGAVIGLNAASPDLEIYVGAAKRF